MAFKISEVVTLKAVNADREACYLTVRDSAVRPQTHRIKLTRFLMNQIVKLKIGQRIRLEGEYEINAADIKYKINSVKSEE